MMHFQVPLQQILLQFSDAYCMFSFNSSVFGSYYDQLLWTKTYIGFNLQLVGCWDGPKWQKFLVLRATMCVVNEFSCYKLMLASSSNR